MLKKLVYWMYAATLYVERDSPLRRAHIVAKLASVLLYSYAVLSVSDPLRLGILAAYPLMLGAADRDLRSAAYAYRAPLIPVLVVSFLTLLLSPAGPLSPGSAERAASLGLRLLGLAAGLMVFVNATDPQQVTSLLYSLRAPPWLAESIPVTWRLIPVTLRDTGEALTAIRLRGARTWDILAPLTAVSLSRSRSIAESLYVKGLGLRRRRKTLKGAGRPLEGLALFLSTLGLVLPLIYF